MNSVHDRQPKACNILNGFWENNSENEDKERKNNENEKDGPHVHGLREFAVKKLKMSHPNSSQKEACLIVGMSKILVGTYLNGGRNLHP